jgi:hypothetical protein
MIYRYFEQYELFLKLPEKIKPDWNAYYMRDEDCSVKEAEEYSYKLESYNKWLSSGIHILKEHLHLFVGRDVDESEFEIETDYYQTVGCTTGTRLVAIPIKQDKEYYQYNGTMIPFSEIEVKDELDFLHDTDSDEIFKFLTSRNKPFFIDHFRKLLVAFNNTEISFSKFVEELNIIAYEWNKKQNAEWWRNKALEFGRDAMIAVNDELLKIAKTLNLDDAQTDLLIERSDMAYNHWKRKATNEAAQNQLL